MQIKIVKVETDEVLWEGAINDLVQDILDFPDNFRTHN